MAREILTTRLHRPEMPPDWVARAGPFERLHKGCRGALTLVSAPAGYGKSTTVAAWLASRDEPSAWLSLEPDDGDGVFASYLVAAVRTLFPEACPLTLALLDAPTQPPASELARVLANELDAIETSFLLALDDYQAIGGPSVPELLDRLLAHPPRCLHLILITRHDPPLALASLRARGGLTELRLQDLRFDRSESERLVVQGAQLALGQRPLDHLVRVMDGWPVGLRLAALAARDQEDAEAFVCGLEGATHEMQEYLVPEVLAGLSAANQEWLIRSSILDRFCAALCEAVCAEEGAGEGLGGAEFVETLHARGLFAIALDPRREWHRYHHVFQGLLRERLKRQCTPDRIAALHARAARWYDQNDLPEEALQHALAAGDDGRACEVVRKNRREILNQEQWGRLDRWLGRLPGTVADGDPEILVSRAWCCEFLFRSCPPDHLRRAEERLAKAGRPAAKRGAIEAEIDALRSVQGVGAGEFRRALDHSERALAALPAAAEAMRAYALAMGALARQGLGDRRGALASLHASLADHDASASLRSPMLSAVAYVHWLEGDLAALRRSALESLELGEARELRASVAYAHYLLGIAHYVRDERVETERHLEGVVAQRYFASQREYLHASFALALHRLCEGRTEEARATLEAVSRQVVAAGLTRPVEQVRAFEAELDLRTGRVAQAVRWARTRESEPHGETYLFHSPQLTLARAWLAEGSDESRRSAADLLDQLLDGPLAAHNVPVRIGALGLRALAHAADGDEASALAKLAESLELAAPGGFVRPFVDLGEPMASLLERLPAPLAGSEHIGRIRAAFAADRAAAGGRAPSASFSTSGPAPLLPEPLTNREQDVLELLAERLRDKEIAQQLVISPATVKSHLKCLYRKLDVGGRREAVTRARELGILARPAAPAR